MTRTIHRSAVIALALASGCAGASMSRTVDEDGGLGSGEDSSDGGTLPPTTDPSGDPSTDPTTDPGSSDGADSDPATSADDESSGNLPGSSSDGGESGNDSSSSGAGSSGNESTSSGAAIESSSDDGETAAADDIDISGYTIVQTDSDRELVLPGDTLVPLGGCLVIGRNASPAAFQTFWDVSWGDEVVYIDGADDFPSINGDEAYSLRSPADVLLDGPTPVLEASTALWRDDADDLAAWNVDMSPNSASTPGISDAVGGSSGTPYLSEYSDPTGAGNFAYEFVEVCIAP
ncbi:MAG: hypothetical protein IAG13_05535 [Deltaproteobacteria bacterium]|nr:hypothetical protein [Nannocystaceae bacterium]